MAGRRGDPGSGGKQSAKINRSGCPTVMPWAALQRKGNYALVAWPNPTSSLSNVTDYGPTSHGSYFFRWKFVLASRRPTVRDISLPTAGAGMRI